MESEGADGFFSFVDIKISIKRRSVFYAFNFVLPNLILAILSISGFGLPSDCGEKISLRNFIKSYFYTVKSYLYCDSVWQYPDHKK